MPLYFPAIAAQFDLITSIGGVAAAIGVSFFIITLVASYYRFLGIVEKAEHTSPEEMGAEAREILRVQLARYLAGCARRGTSFSIALIRLPDLDHRINMDSSVIIGVKNAVRRKDVIYVFDDRTVVVLLESEPEDGVVILSRIVRSLEQAVDALSPGGARVGIVSYPGHALSGKALVKAAEDALDRASAEEPIVLPEIEDVDAEDEKESEPEDALESKEGPSKEKKKDRRKDSMLDELTGVLKPSAISAYMQRTMNELRRKKEKAALFCVGLNNMDHITRFHGEAVADSVMAEVSQILQNHLRSEDLIGRHENFAYLVLAQCSLEEADLIGKRVTTQVQNTVFFSGKTKLKITITLGVATFPEHGRNLHFLYLAGQKVLNHSRAHDIRSMAVYDPKIHDKVQVKPMKNIKSTQQ
ncbi:MAG: diguanylate cyclase [Pontiella sp.]